MATRNVVAGSTLCIKLSLGTGRIKITMLAGSIVEHLNAV
jgi:hypothetical protein